MRQTCSTALFSRTHALAQLWTISCSIHPLCTARVCRSMVGVARPKQRRDIAEKEPSPKRPRADTEFDSAKRGCLVVGLRATIRHLERGALCAGLLCLSTCPLLLQQQLLTLVAVREIPFVALHDLSPALAPLLGMSSVAALGLTAAAPTHFPHLLDTLHREAPAVQLPWLCAHHHSQQALKEGTGSIQERRQDDTPSKGKDRSGGRSGPSPVYCVATLTKVPTAPNPRKVKRRTK